MASPSEAYSRIIVSVCYEHTEYAFGGDEGSRTPVQNTFLVASYNHRYNYIFITPNCQWLPMTIAVIRLPNTCRVALVTYQDNSFYLPQKFVVDLLQLKLQQQSDLLRCRFVLQTFQHRHLLA